MMHLTRVDLPAPFSPSSTWKPPAGTLSDTSSSAVKLPKRFDMPTVETATARPTDDARSGAGAGSAMQGSVILSLLKRFRR